MYYHMERYVGIPQSDNYKITAQIEMKYSASTFEARTFTKYDHVMVSNITPAAFLFLQRDACLRNVSTGVTARRHRIILPSSI